MRVLKCKSYKSYLLEPIDCGKRNICKIKSLIGICFNNKKKNNSIKNKIPPDA